MSPGRWWGQDWWAGEPDDILTPVPTPQPLPGLTGQDLLAYVLRRAGELLPTTASGSADVGDADRLIDAKAYILQSYVELCGLKPWRWNRAHKQFSSIGEVAVTVQSVVGNLVTLTAPVTPSMAGRKVLITADGIPCRIAGHTANTPTLALEIATYTGLAGSGSGAIFQDEIDVGVTDILGYPRIKELHIGDFLDIIPESELDQVAPRNVYGRERAEQCAFIDAHTIRIVPWTRAPRLFELRYTPRPNTLSFDGVVATDTPILPPDFRIIIGDRACERIYADKNDPRQKNAASQVQDTYSRMSGVEIQYGKPRGRPRKGQSVSGR
jgi:hypothetical protein